VEDDQGNQRPSTIAPSPQRGDRKRSLNPRAIILIGIAAALILAVIATTIYTQFAAHRTASPTATKVAAPNATFSWPHAFTAAPDGSLWYSASSLRGPAIGRVTPEGAHTEFPIPTGDAAGQMYLEAMAIGSDGATWISGENYNNGFTSFMMRMTPGGAFTSFPLPAGLRIDKMIAGSDGAIWFMGVRDPGPEAHDSLIGRIALDGSVSTFPTLSQSKGAGLLDICVGPDKAIWYTWARSHNDVTGAGRIGRVSLSGQVKEFDVLASVIASGSDGALWYSEIVPNTMGDMLGEMRQGYIGRITTTGDASELPIDPSTRIRGIAAGSDGAIWYTVYGDDTGAFGRITSNGDVKTFSTGGSAQIVFIASAPGALWLFDSRNNLWHYRLPG
jgi:streptogramin lyase